MIAAVSSVGCPALRDLAVPDVTDLGGPVQGGRIAVNGHLIGYREENGTLVEDREQNIARQRQDIGMVFQRFNLFPHMTALGNVIEAQIRVRGTTEKDAADVGGHSPSEVIEVKQELAHEGSTMIVVTHERAFAREAADRVYFIEEGTFIEGGPPEQVLDNPQDEQTRRFLRRLLSSGVAVRRRGHHPSASAVPG